MDSGKEHEAKSSKVSDLTRARSVRKVVQDKSMRRPNRNGALRLMKTLSGISNVLRPLAQHFSKRKTDFDVAIIDIDDLDSLGDANTTLNWEERKPLVATKSAESSFIVSKAASFPAWPCERVLSEKRMDALLSDDCTDLCELRKVAKTGCTVENRPQVWRHLLGYEPLQSIERVSQLDAKRKEYQEKVRCLHTDSLPYRLPSEESSIAPAESDQLCVLGSVDQSLEAVKRREFSALTLRQIEMDLPRTHPDLPLFHTAEMRQILRRILYIHSMEHPEYGYVQGMNEILTPIVVVSLCQYVGKGKFEKLDELLVIKDLKVIMAEDELFTAEADAFWLLSNILSAIADNFVAGQPGILRCMQKLERLVKVADPELSTHFHENGIEFLQFSFRWMNCLMMREFSLPNVVHLWDGLLSAEKGLSDLLVYFCAALVTHFRKDLLAMDFQETIMFLQNLPTRNWTDRTIEGLLDISINFRLADGDRT